ncbi:MAG TPA: AAA family ATPase [Acidimicrobiia bacterium]|nr:AAA family ATPase [Acidimicrobiia bacterium]
MSTSRTCTILFTDLVGSTELRASLGDDEFDVRRRAHDQLLADTIVRHGGEVVKFGGDGVMAVFTSAADALSCGVAVQQGVTRDRRHDTEPLVVRVGVSAGDVADEDGDFHGTPVVEAARLCDAARGGQVLAADVVRVLAGTRGGHQFVPLGALELKGLPGPLVAWEIGWSVDPESAIVVPSRLAEVGARGRCVGRDTELEVLVDAWKRVVTGERRLVLVAGEPGIGKTRLAAELATRVVDHGGVAIHGWCDEDLGAPFQPWVHALGALVRSCDADELAEVSSGIAADLTRLVPDLALRLPAVVGSQPTDVDTERARVVDAVDVLLERASAARPLLVVLDDLHWADRPTLSLLLRLLRSDRPGAVLFVGTYRDTDVDRRHPLADALADLRREPRAARVSLDGLDEAGLGALLADRAGHDAPAEFVRLLSEGTDGNPFFIEEVLAHLVETGAIVHRDGMWTTDLAPGEIGLPEGVRDVVGRRLSRLPEQANDVLTVAAIVGREFALPTVIAAGRFERDAALDMIDAALATGLVVEVPHTAGSFAFSHALVRQTLEEEIGGPKRARLHWRVGEALAAQREVLRSAVAFHLCEGVLAGEPGVAAAAAVDAADEASTIGAVEEARVLAARALEVLHDADSRRPDLECRAQLVIGGALAFAQSDYPAARQAIVTAAEIAQSHGWADLASKAALVYGRVFVPGAIDPVAEQLARAALELGGSDEWRPALLAFLGGSLVVAGKWADGVALLDEALDGVASANPEVRAATFVMRSTIYWGWPDISVSESAAQQALVASEVTGSTYHLLGARMSIGIAALRNGDRARFRAELAELRALAESRSTTLLVDTLWDGTEALLDGRLADSERLAGELLANVAPDAGFFSSATAQFAAGWYWMGRDDELLAATDLFSADQPGMRAALNAVRASTLARRGDTAASLAFYEPLAADGFADLPHDFNRPGLICHLANATLWLGDVARAERLEPLVAAYAGQLLVAGQACLVYDSADSLRGALLSMLGRHDEAVACGEAAAELCERSGCVPTAVKNGHQLAAALVARGYPGDGDRAKALAGEALARAQSLGLEPDVRFARAVLDRIG